MSQLALGWSVIDSLTPTDIYRLYKRDVTQIFVVDDTFGRTEYSPTAGSEWERDLGKILRLLDAQHWLIWTSRKHIFERAMGVLDTQVPSSVFPGKAEIIVQAEKLSTREKALILYRHSVAANLSEEARAIIKLHARFITFEQHFTPERIRRMIAELVPRLASEHAEREVIRETLSQSIRNPTKQMRKEYAKLDRKKKWLLVCLLNEKRSATISGLLDYYKELLPGENAQELLGMAEELEESFLKRA
jgi:hypothetical protein